MNVVVVGHGSAGSRHARILSALDCKVCVVSARQTAEWPQYQDLGAALDAFNPGYVVLANGTRDHYPALERLAHLGFTGLVLVEKPLFHAPLPIPAHEFEHLFVAYNLRFHPILQKLRSLLQFETIVAASIYAGQYLPQWRPGTDFRRCYSAHKDAGGGVLRDLSHEIDYALWLLGNWRAVSALGGHLSSLEIDSDDVFSLLLATERCPVVNIQIDYLDRPARRALHIVTDTHTFSADLNRGVLEIDGQSEQFHVERDEPYRLQHQAVMRRQLDTLCSASEGLDVLALIDATERAAGGKQWVSR